MEPKKHFLKIKHFLVSYFKKANKKVAVVGLSGGLDSSVTVALCVHALGAQRVLAVLLPSSSTPPQDMQDAKMLAKMLSVQTVSVSIDPILEKFESLSLSKLEKANLSARIRMALLYLFAQKQNGLVVGTSDKSELMLGYFTKYGDGAADLLPIARLYKSEVKALGKFLQIPQNILSKPPSPQLWKGQTAQNELGFSYEEADAVLMEIEKKASKHALYRRFGKKLVDLILERMRQNRHKLLLPPSP
ncbi:MAG: NAD+ synthase [Candidatus Anstonellaceae archaeon]